MGWISHHCAYEGTNYRLFVALSRARLIDIWRRRRCSAEGIPWSVWKAFWASGGARRSVTSVPKTRICGMKSWWTQIHRGIHKNVLCSSNTSECQIDVAPNYMCKRGSLYNYLSEQSKSNLSFLSLSLCLVRFVYEGVGDGATLIVWELAIAKCPSSRILAKFLPSPLCAIH